MSSEIAFLCTNSATFSPASRNRSIGVVPAAVGEAASTVSRALLVTAIAALGIKTSLRAMTQVGGGHIGVVVLETLVLLAAALALVQFGHFAL